MERDTPHRLPEGFGMSARMKEPVILLLENEDNDVFFIRRALAAIQYKGQVHVVATATQARSYLEGTGEFKDRAYFPMPDLIISDLKMPGKTGVEFLEWLRNDTRYFQIPFVMLSGSALPEDREAAFRNGARAFFTKSGDFSVMRERVQEILTYMRRPQAADTTVVEQSSAAEKPATNLGSPEDDTSAGKTNSPSA
jgi:two-component system, chemotaxis family, response regulator Rcp1